MAYSKVERRTWHDERFRRWPKDRRDLWLYLLTTPHLDQPGGRFGCCVLDPMYAAADLSAPDDRWTPERVERQLAELEQEGRIVWDPDARLVLIVRFFDHNRPENPNVVKAMVRDIDAAPYSDRVMTNLLETVRERLPERFEKGGELGVAIQAAIEARIDREKAGCHNCLPGTNINPSERVAGTVPKGLGEPFPIQEHEHKQEQITTTEDKSSEAGPRGLVADAEAEGSTDRPAAPPPPNSNDEESDDAKVLDLPAIRAQLAPAIREHLWLGNEPPHLVALSKPGWNMGRELNIATGFIERGEATVEELIGAMKYARHVLHHAEVKPISMLAFNGKGRRDRLNEAIALWRREQMKKRFHDHTKRQALDEVMVGLDRGERATA